MVRPFAQCTLLMLLVLPISSLADEWEFGFFAGTQLLTPLQDRSNRRDFPEYRPRISLGFDLKHEFTNGTKLDIEAETLFRFNAFSDFYLPEATLQFSVGTVDVLFGSHIESWGVTEAAELVDILNQTDLKRDLSGDTRLGQPMLRISRQSSWGWLGFYYLPWSPKRPFAYSFGLDGVPVTYQSRHKKWEPGFALRYAHNIDDWDFGAFIFHGSDRNPALLTYSDRAELHYPIMTQIGAYTQLTRGSTYMRGELLYSPKRFGTDGNRRNELSFSVEVEHELSGLFANGQGDLSLLAAYSGNTRNDSPDLFQDDISLGTKLTWNTIAMPELTLLVTRDVGYGSSFATLSYEQRLGDTLKLELEAVEYFNIDPFDTLAPLEDAGYLSAKIIRHF